LPKLAKTTAFQQVVNSVGGRKSVN